MSGRHPQKAAVQDGGQGGGEDVSGHHSPAGREQRPPGEAAGPAGREAGAAISRGGAGRLA